MSQVKEEISIPPSALSRAMPHQLMLHMTYHWLIIILHRPFYRQKQVGVERKIDHIRVRSLFSSLVKHSLTQLIALQQGRK